MLRVYARRVSTRSGPTADGRVWVFTRSLSVARECFNGHKTQIVYTFVSAGVLLVYTAGLCMCVCLHPSVLLLFRQYYYPIEQALPLVVVGPFRPPGNMGSFFGGWKIPKVFCRGQVRRLDCSRICLRRETSVSELARTSYHFIIVDTAAMLIAVCACLYASFYLHLSR